MANHTEYVELAHELINEEGRTITLQKLSGAVANVDKPWQGPATPVVEVQTDVKAVFLPASGNDFSSLAATKEMLAKVSQVALIAPNALDLSKMTLLLDGGIKYKIEWVSTLKPADQVCLYAMGVCQ
jgi:hypothetical protein